jgi:hypothetical protein
MLSTATQGSTTLDSISFLLALLLQAKKVFTDHIFAIKQYM